MTPYYEQDGVVIYHGDCREVMPSLGPDGDVPGNARECAQLWEREAVRLRHVRLPRSSPQSESAALSVLRMAQTRTRRCVLR